MQERAADEPVCFAATTPETMEETMITSRKLLYSAALLAFSITASQAGPCSNTTSRDAGAGATPGYSGQTTGSASASGDTKGHPPTDTMNKAAGNTATSSQDAQRQMQGQPTASQEAEGAKKTASPDQGC
jgi:hypothetical protein